MIIKKEYKLKSPRMPNYINTEAGKTIPITDLTSEQAEEFGEFMKKQFINHYISKKTGIRPKTLEDMDQAMDNLAKGIVSDPIDLDELEDLISDSEAE